MMHMNRLVLNLNGESGDELSASLCTAIGGSVEAARSAVESEKQEVQHAQLRLKEAESHLASIEGLHRLLVARLAVPEGLPSPQAV